MSIPQWYILKDAAGNLRQVVTDDGLSPAKHGEDMTGKVSYPMQRAGNLDTEVPDLNAGTWSTDLTILKTKLLAQIDSLRESKQMVYLTKGSAKTVVYAQKAKEVNAYNNAVVGVVLTLTEQQTAYPAAMAEAAATNQTLAQVMVRFNAGITKVNNAVYKIEAIAQMAKTAVGAATTVAAANAAYSAITWP